MIKGCIQLGHMPDFHVALNAIPVDQLAKLISHGVLYPAPVHRSGIHTLHVDCEQRLTMDQLHSTLRRYGFPVQKCDYSTWVQHLAHAMSEGDDNALLPVLEFVLHDLERVLTTPRLDTANTAALCSQSTVMQAAKITSETMALYLAWLVKVGEMPAPCRSSETARLPTLTNSSVFFVSHRTGA